MALVQFDTLTFPAGNPFSASDANSLIRNARQLDALSQRGRRVWTNAIMRYPWEYDQAPTVVFKGAFQYRSGVTNLNIIGEATFPGGGTHTLRVYLNGVLRHSATWVTARTNYFFAINALGFTDLDIIDVEVRDDWTGADGQPVVVDAYIDAMSAAGPGYGGVPTFGALSEANLTQLMNAQTWAYNRLNYTDQCCLMGSMFMTGYAHSTSAEALLFDGGFENTNGATRLIIGLRYHILANQSETVRVRINSSEVATATFTIGQGGDYEFNLDISALSTDNPHRLTIVQTINTLPLSGERQLGSRYTLTDIFTKKTTYPVATLPAATYEPGDSMTFSALQGILNQVATATNAAVTRIGSAIGAFNRQRVFRWRPGSDDGQSLYYQNVLVAKGRRAHDALWVRGKGLKIGYGALTIEAVPDSLYKWTPQYEQDLIGGDDILTRLVYFDQFPGLVAGMEYYIYGEHIVYAAEAVRA